MLHGPASGRAVPMSDPIWVGSTMPQIMRLVDASVSPVGVSGHPAFLAEHPSQPRLYAVDEADPGEIAAFAIDGGGWLRRTGAVSSGGSFPCHLLVHPDGGWLYTANYGDGVATALRLDDAGDVTGERVELPHTGRGPNAARQEGPHAHSTWVSPGGGWLVVADLGTDHLRSYRLDGGRPLGPPALTTLPAGSGPRHAALAGDLVHVACELSCEVITLRWDEVSGTGEVLAAVGAVTLPARSGEDHTLSHLEMLDDDTLVVGVRGADSLAVIGLADGVVDGLRAEVLTVAWPRHLTVVGDEVLVAGERADLIGVHPVVRSSSGAVVGELARRIDAPAPMCLLPAR